VKKKQKKQNNQNGFYDINRREGAMQAQPPRHRPYDKHLREQVVHLYFVSGVKCSATARWFSGRPCRKTVQRIIQDYRVHRAVRLPTESMMQWLPSCWCLLCRMTCRFDTCLHCTSLAMLARTSVAGTTRTHTFRALLLCVGSLCAYEEGGCLRLTAQAPAVSLAPSARG